MVLNLKNQITDCIEKEINTFGSLKRDIAKRNSVLKDKTLLIFDPLISYPLKETIEKKEIEKYYKGKYEIMSFEKADSIIAKPVRQGQ